MGNLIHKMVKFNDKSDTMSYNILTYATVPFMIGNREGDNVSHFDVLRLVCKDIFTKFFDELESVKV